MNLSEKIWDLIFTNGSCACKQCLSELLLESKRYKNNPLLTRIVNEDDYRSEITKIIYEGDEE